MGGGWVITILDNGTVIGYVKACDKNSCTREYTGTKVRKTRLITTLR